MQRLLKFVVNPVSFAIGYIIIMMPTYILPYMGSNSVLINAAGSAAGAGVYPLFLIHLGCLAGLILMAWARGTLIGKNWLIALPIAAGLFDMVPGLSLIPMVPTTFHIITIVLGVKEERAAPLVATPSSTSVGGAVAMPAKCPGCDAVVTAEDVFCGSCGRKLQ